MNGVADTVVMSIHALFNDIFVVLEDARKTCPWFFLTIAMAYVTTASQDICKFRLAGNSVLIMSTVLVYSKTTLFGAYGILILIIAGILQKSGTETMYAHALCCSCRYISWIMIAFLCSNIRLIIDHVSIIEEDRTLKMNANGRMVNDYGDGDGDSDEDSEEEPEEDLTGIVYDGYLCFK